MDNAAGDDRTLRRIIATLVALAVLAERAAVRSFPVRWFVLALLRYAERVARDFVAETTGWDRSDLEEAFGFADDPDGRLGDGSGPADAMALGWRLRMLAALLGALLPPDGLPGLANDCAGGIAALRRLASHVASRLAASAGRTHPAPDTS